MQVRYWCCGIDHEPLSKVENERLSWIGVERERINNNLYCCIPADLHVRCQVDFPLTGEKSLQPKSAVTAGGLVCCLDCCERIRIVKRGRGFGWADTGP